jgi:broad specificity phosphatase PhoE
LNSAKQVQIILIRPHTVHRSLAVQRKGRESVKSSPQRRNRRRAAAVAEEMTLALPLWDAGEQARRRKAGIRGATKT